MKSKQIEQLSRKILVAQQELREELETERYIRLAEQNTMPPSEQAVLQDAVRQEIQELKTSADTLREAYQRLSADADELETRLKEGRNSEQRKHLFRKAPANSVIDLEEQKTGHFASGLNLYKLILLIVIGSFAGVVVESVWCLLKNGYLESRSGLVYGPFNLLYGVGAVVLSIALYQFRNRSTWFSFLGGMIVGSVVEYACSWGQEMLFDSTSWDYSGMPFNLNGRICLLYSVFWGLLGILWMKSLYPRMAKWILKLPNRSGRVITIGLAVFMACNGIISLMAVDRWSERVEGKPAVNVVDRLFDDRFPDERMKRIFANMEFGN